MQGRRYPITSLLHWTCSLLLLGLSIYVIVLAWSGGVTLFSLHPVLMVIAVSIIVMSIAIIVDPYPIDRSFPVPADVSTSNRTVRC